MNKQQLRAQIAALQDATMDENKNFRTAYDEGKFDALSAVDALLDSLQEEPVSENLEEAAKIYTVSLVVNEIIPDATVKQLREVADKSFKAGANWRYEQFENNRLAACDNMTKEEFDREQKFTTNFIEKNNRIPTYSDAIEYGRKQMIDKAIKWLEDNIDRYLYNTGGYEEYIPKCGGKMFEDFKKAMEE